MNKITPNGMKHILLRLMNLLFIKILTLKCGPSTQLNFSNFFKCAEITEVIGNLFFDSVLKGNCFIVREYLERLRTILQLNSKLKF